MATVVLRSYLPCGCLSLLYLYSFFRSLVPNSSPLQKEIGTSDSSSLVKKGNLTKLSRWPSWSMQRVVSRLVEINHHALHLYRYQFPLGYMILCIRFLSNTFSMAWIVAIYSYFSLIHLQSVISGFNCWNSKSLISPFRQV